MPSRNFFGTNLVIACYCMCYFFLVLRLKIQVGLLLLECMACKIFLELIWLLHVIVCAFFLGFKNENPGWLVIT